MNKEQYQAWLEYPQTKLFHQFLLDYRQSVMEKWANGVLNDDNALAERATAQFAYLLVNLDDEAIEEFYKNRKVEVNDAE